MNILGLLSYGINPAVCLIQNGNITFIAEEERYCRIKNASGRRPFNAIKSALNYSGLSLNDIDYIAIGWDHSKYPNELRRFYDKYMNYQQDIVGETIKEIHLLEFNPEYETRMLEYGLRSIGLEGKIPEIKFYSHHLSHAASVYYVSPFEEALIISMDGSGEESTTVIYKGEGSHLTEIDKYQQPFSLGWFYTAFTEFLGFKSYSGEGKLMGLAPYGKSNLEIRNKLHKILYWENNRYVLDPTYIYFGQRTYSRRFTDKLCELFGEPRTPESDDFSEYHKDLAYEVQRKLEEIVIEMVKHYIKLTGINNICLTGGVAMNCKLNGVINNLPFVKSLFINPASNDAGVSIGAALLCNHELGLETRINVLDSAFWGPEFSNEQIKQYLTESKLKFHYHHNIEEVTAQKIFEGKIVGWFQGRMEIGARALGNRSILANPIIKEMKDKINHEIKHRESFRPLAPSILQEYQDQYLVKSSYSPFMIIADYVKEDMRSIIPAVIHEDGSVRHQTVTKQNNERYWNLIQEFYKLSGVPVLLNTSLNVRGEPIALSPLDAIRCFYSNGLDVIVIGNYLLEKK
jgi:carbamoyltransferase